jgi:hypothetical protein
VLQLQAAAPGTVRGVISFDGTTPVPFANVFITQTDNTGQTTTFFPNTPLDDQGRYFMTGLSAGPFTLTAQSDGGLTGTVQGTVTDPSVPVVLNVILPPSSVVSATISKSTGAPAVGAEAALFSPGIAFYYDLFPADAQGVIRFAGVPAGPFSIYSYDPDCLTLPESQSPGLRMAPLARPGPELFSALLSHYRTQAP